MSLFFNAKIYSNLQRRFTQNFNVSQQNCGKNRWKAEKQEKVENEYK
jgi:hypothetical protein